MIEIILDKDGAFLEGEFFLEINILTLCFWIFF